MFEISSNDLIVSVLIETDTGNSGLEFSVPSGISLGGLGGLISERVSGREQYRQYRYCGVLYRYKNGISGYKIGT